MPAKQCCMAQLTKLSSWMEHSFVFCFLASSINITSAFSLGLANPFGVFSKAENWFAMTSMSHSLIPLVWEGGCTEGKKSHQFWEKWLWGPANPVALLLEECWCALFTTRTDRFPLFCSCLGEGSTSRWFSGDSIKLAHTSKWNDLQILLWRR